MVIHSLAPCDTPCLYPPLKQKEGWSKVHLPMHNKRHPLPNHLICSADQCKGSLPQTLPPQPILLCAENTHRCVSSSLSFYLRYDADDDEQTKDDDTKHIFVVQYLNKQTTALREVNDSRLRIYEQVFIIVIIFIFIIYEQILQIKIIILQMQKYLSYHNLLTAVDLNHI